VNADIPNSSVRKIGLPKIIEVFLNPPIPVRWYSPNGTPLIRVRWHLSRSFLPPLPRSHASRSLARSCPVVTRWKLAVVPGGAASCAQMRRPEIGLSAPDEGRGIQTGRASWGRTAITEGINLTPNPSPGRSREPEDARPRCDGSLTHC